ncbi:MAG: hypothetical protein ACLQBY_02565 [Solirubrobacteraceae bacterium]
MGKAKRCRAVAISASVAAIGAATACPAANAASEAAPTAHAPRAAVTREHAGSRRRRKPSVAPKPATHQGDYVYTVVIGETEADENTPNVTCTGAGMRITGLGTYAESPDATALWERTPAAWKRAYTVTTGPATTITVGWTPPSERREVEEESDAHNGFILNPRLWSKPDTALASTICAATTPGAVVGEVGEALATWALPAPARSAAALMATPPTNVYPNELRIAFEVLPDGSVPAFTPMN